jgi:valyl-tRNA synthetase
VHLAAALVGPPDPGLVLRRRGCGETIVSREDPTTCPGCGGACEQDEDVLDTWFSSWLVAVLVARLARRDRRPEGVLPGNTLVTAPEILFFWVARMIMAGIEFMGDVPFRTSTCTGRCATPGRKMSKSLGNGIDPLEVVDRYGADALRYTVVSMAAVGTDIILDHGRPRGFVRPGRNFANKLWNIGRFALMSWGRSPVRPLATRSGHLEPGGPLDPLAPPARRRR